MDDHHRLSPTDFEHIPYSYPPYLRHRWALLALSAILVAVVIFMGLGWTVAGVLAFVAAWLVMVTAGAAVMTASCPVCGEGIVRSHVTRRLGLKPRSAGLFLVPGARCPNCGYDWKAHRAWMKRRPGPA